MRKSVKVLLLFLVITITTFVAIAMWLDIQNAHDDFENDVIVESNGKTVENFTIDNLTLNPGGKEEYIINLYCKAEGTFSVVLDYNEIENGGLKNFVDVEVKLNDQTIYTDTLEDLLKDGSLINFSTELYSDSPAVIKFIYRMSDKIKNEAQGTYADFDIKLSIEKE